LGSQRAILEQRLAALEVELEGYVQEELFDDAAEVQVHAVPPLFPSSSLLH